MEIQTRSPSPIEDDIVSQVQSQMDEGAQQVAQKMNKEIDDFQGFMMYHFVQVNGTAEEKAAHSEENCEYCSMVKGRSSSPVGDDSLMMECEQSNLMYKEEKDDIMKMLEKEINRQEKLDDHFEQAQNERTYGQNIDGAEDSSASEIDPDVQFEEQNDSDSG